MGLHLIFDQSADTYDRVRPRYVKALFDDVCAYARVGESGRALEVGAGTGQATAPFLEAGLYVTVLEPGARMAALLTAKFGENPRFRVENALFEDYAGAGDFDLIYAATSFHWIAEEAGYPKALSLLKPGGALALFWNHPYPGKCGGAMFEAVDRVHRKYSPGPPPVPFDEREVPAKRLIPLQYGFVDVESRVYYAERRLSAAEYVAVLNTYSGHLALAPGAKEGLEREIAAAIDEHGGTITVFDTIDLYLARRSHR